MYVFGVGPLVDPANINALASKKNNEQHVFKVKDMEDLENVFFQMIGRKMQGNVWGSCLQTGVADFPHPGRLPPPSIPVSTLTSCSSALPDLTITEL